MKTLVTLISLVLVPLQSFAVDNLKMYKQFQTDFCGKDEGLSQEIRAMCNSSSSANEFAQRAAEVVSDCIKQKSKGLPSPNLYVDCKGAEADRLNANIKGYLLGAVRQEQLSNCGSAGDKGSKPEAPNTGK